jgi:hypothetical protein
MAVMQRREVLKSGAAAAALSTVGLAQVKRQGWQPLVFSPAQNELVVTLAELIVPATDTPGAKAANVNRYMDLFLSEAPSEDRERFLQSLNWFEEYAVKEAGAPFVKLEPSRQIALLEKLDAGGPGLDDGKRFFTSMKAMTARFYYQTEIGYKELNKNGVAKNLGCKDAAHKG